MNNDNSRYYVFFQKTFKLLGILALIASFIAAFWLYKKGLLSDTNALKHFILRYHFWGPFIFIVVQIFQIIFPVIPGGLTTVAGFVIFGPVEGFIYNYVGIIVGSIILFELVRVYGVKFILLFVDQKTFQKYEQRLDTKGYERFFIFCMASPVSPADLMVMLTGLTRMSFKRFLIIILLSKPISIISYSYLLIFGGDLLKWLHH
ncbi:MAG: hypothetical protein DI617_04185 [Streptococcus pyogenes]|nr:MAG: hypothetical protein DI617_04185 [Streptococcus pyogenes]